MQSEVIRALPEAAKGLCPLDPQVQRRSALEAVLGQSRLSVGGSGTKSRSSPAQWRGSEAI